MFTKLFSSITTSSIWNEDNNTRIVWITMLAMANKNGYVAASVGGLAHEARVTREDCEKALEVLKSPDIDSRSKEFEGRRVEIVDGGFQLLNHAKYRAMRSEEERKEYMKTYMVEYRARTKAVNNSVNNVSECKPPLAQAEERRGEENRNTEEAADAAIAMMGKKISKQPSKFIWMWSVAYREFFGNEYMVTPGKDEKASDRLTGLRDVTPEDLIVIARKAWAMPDGFNTKQAVSISGFTSRFNEIRKDVGSLSSQSKKRPSFDEYQEALKKSDQNEK